MVFLGEGFIWGWDVSYRDARRPLLEYEMHGRISLIEVFPAHLERGAVFCGDAVGVAVFFRACVSSSALILA